MNKGRYTPLPGSRGARTLPIPALGRDAAPRRPLYQYSGFRCQVSGEFQVSGIRRQVPGVGK